MKVVGLEGDVVWNRPVRPIVIMPLSRRIERLSGPAAFSEYAERMSVPGADILPGNEHVLLFDLLGAYYPLGEEPQFWLFRPTGQVYVRAAFVFGVTDLVAPAGNPEPGYERLLEENILFLGNRRETYQHLRHRPELIGGALKEVDL